MRRIVLVGCGKHMQTTLVPYLRQMDGYEVEACIDLDEVAARRVQQAMHARNWATSIEDIDLCTIDAAIIALPPQAAYQVTSQLLERRIACFVEKPPASTSDEIKQLAQLARAREVYVQIGFNFRFANAIAAFYASVADYKGAPCTANIEFRSKHPSGAEWEKEDPVEAWLYHNGIHALDLLLWTVGDAHQVSASITRTAEGKFTIVALISHINQSISTLKMGTLTDKFDLRAEITTPDAHQFYLPNLGEVVMPRRNGKVGGEIIYIAGNLDNGWGRAGYGPELQYFLNNFSKYENSYPSLLDALKASQLSDAILCCLQRGNPVTLSQDI